MLITRRIQPQVEHTLSFTFDLITNPNDVLWSEQELIQLAKDHAVWGIMATPTEKIGQNLIQQCPNLRIVANIAVGYDNLDLLAIRHAGLAATNTPDVLTEATADFGMALLLATARRITEAERYLRSGQWQKWSLDLLCGFKVSGSCLGILGMGRIGQAIAQRAWAGFGMKVLYHNRHALPPTPTPTPNPYQWVDKRTLFQQSDHVMLTLPRNDQTYHSVGATELAWMKPSATLINLARGGIVDEIALIKALKQGHLAAAGLDVFEGEPDVHPDFLTLSNVVLTPHLGSATHETRLQMSQLAAENLLTYWQTGQLKSPIM